MPEFDPSGDYEARQLALIREQKPIVEALRKSGYDIDFLFSPKNLMLSEAARALLAEFLQRAFSLDTKLMISDLLEQDESPHSARSGEPESESAPRITK